jgi:pimeloyl-ACP methyl ester carboxylesterase
MKRRWARLALLVAVLAPLLVVARVAYRGATDRLLTLDPPRKVAERSAVSGIEPLVDVAFVDPHRRTIRGWFHPGTNGATVLLLHGFAANRAQLAPEMHMLAEEGYGFLAYDAPGHGESDGTTTWGDTEQDTLRAAVDFVLQQTSVDPKRLGALGFSLGGAVLALTAPTEPRIRAVVLEAAFSTLYEEIRGDSGPWGVIAAKPGQWAIERRGIPVDRIRPKDGVCAIAPRPLLVVIDTVSPLEYEDQKANYDAACAPKELYEVPGAVHGHYDELDGPTYRKRILGFFGAHLRSP